jgi:hypothetical protein
VRFLLANTNDIDATQHAVPLAEMLEAAASLKLVRR